MIETWEKDKHALNPFARTSKGKLFTLLITAWELLDADECLGPTKAAVQLELYAAEAEALARGDLQMMHDEVTPSVFITSGLELEEQQ